MARVMGPLKASGTLDESCRWLGTSRGADSAPACTGEMLYFLSGWQQLLQHLLDHGGHQLWVLRQALLALLVSTAETWTNHNKHLA